MTVAPALRSDLKVTRQVHRGEVFYIIKEPDAQDYFRFSLIEYQILSLFDGRSSCEQMAQRFSTQHPEYELGATTIEGYAASLKKKGLLQRTAQEKNLLLLEKRREQRKSMLLGKQGSLLYKRFPIIDPDKLLDRLHGPLHFLFTPGFVTFSLACMLGALGVIVYNWEEVLTGIIAIWTFNFSSPWAFVSLWLTVLVVIALHEFAHALTCKHFGGEVHEIGFLLLMFQPCMYANVNDAWTFERRGQRLWVVFAGGYFEFFLGSLAAFLWALTDPTSTVHALSYQAMTVCGFASVLMNFNPLLKYDGYYALSDFLEVPNLKKNAFDYVKHWFQTRIFRLKLDAFPGDAEEHRIYFIYGLAATVYITMMLTAIFFLAHNFFMTTFYAWGLLGSFALAWFLLKAKVLGLWKFSRSFAGQHAATLGGARTKALAAVALLAVGAALFLYQTPLTIEAPCKLEPAARATLRAATEGWLAAVNHDEGDEIPSGAEVLRLVNPDLDPSLAGLALTERKLLAQETAARARGDAAGAQVLALEQAKIRRQAEALRQDQARLAITNPLPRSARLLTSDLPDRRGQLVRAGEEVCELAVTDTLRVAIDVDEREIGAVHPGQRVELKTPASEGRALAGAQVAKIYQRAKPEDESPAGRKFIVWIEIPNPDGLLRVGMSGQVRIHGDPWPLWRLAWRGITRFFRMDLWI